MDRNIGGDLGGRRYLGADAADTPLYRVDRQSLFVRVYHWAALHDRPISWACQPHNWKPSVRPKDEHWSLIEPVLPPQRRTTRGTTRGGVWRDHRKVVNGIFWILFSGAPWRDMPERYASCKTAYDRLGRWQRDATAPGTRCWRREGR